MKHELFQADSRRLDRLADGSVDLVVCSPPAPMHPFWKNSIFNGMSWDDMHNYLLETWRECFRVMKPNAVMCIDAADVAERNNDGTYTIYPNYTKYVEKLLQLGFKLIKTIVWVKSGLKNLNKQDCDHILVFNKIDRSINPNTWVWRLGREKKGSYPIEIPLRLIKLFSRKGDLVLDPFVGRGTTSVACEILDRTSIGFDINSEVLNDAEKRLHARTILCAEEVQLIGE